MLAKKLFNKNSTFRISRGFYSTLKNDKPVEGFMQEPNVKEIKADYIGPPDKLSNIRPILRHIEPNETPLQRKLRHRQLEVQQWVSNFWERHNTSFLAEKAAFAEKHKDITGDNDKWSEFYKNFLDKNWQNHFYFNIEWYLKNFELLFLSLRVQIEKGLKRISGK